MNYKALPVLIYEQVYAGSENNHVVVYTKSLSKPMLELDFSLSITQVSYVKPTDRIVVHEQCKQKRILCFFLNTMFSPVDLKALRVR